MITSLVSLVLVSSLLHGSLNSEDEPPELKPENSAEITSWYLYELGMVDPIPLTEFPNRLIGDRHPDLFGDGHLATEPLWQAPISESLIFEASRNLIRRQLHMDRDFGTRGYIKGVCGQKEDRFCSANHPALLPLPMGGFDLCLLDPLLDAPLLPPARALTGRFPEAICRQNVFQTRHQFLAWPPCDFGENWVDSSDGGVRASFSWDAFLPRNHQFLTFQLTANLDAAGEKGCLLQICWQGSPQSP